MITLYNESANLGDSLMLTPLLNHVPCKLRLLKEEWMEYVSQVFNGMCEIEWFEDKVQMKPLPYAAIPRPWSRRLLVGCGYPDVPSIPIMKLREAEIADGKRFADQLQQSFGKPLCVIKAVPGRSTERVVPPEIIERIVTQNPGIQFITFTFTDRHPKKSMRSPLIKGVFQLEDFPVRAEASVYAAIGRYIGADTGCYHLMLAVGGKADVLCPPSSYSYNHELTHFGPDCWLNLPVRVRYHDFSKPLDQPAVTGIAL